MSRFAKALVFFALLACASGAGALAGEEPSAEQTRQEQEPPAAQVPTLVVGEVVSVDLDMQTFVVMGRPLRRRPPGEVMIAINSDTTMIRDQLVPMDELEVGDVVKVRGQTAGGRGLSIYAQGDVTALEPLAVSVSQKVKVVVEEGAAVGLVRVRELRLADMYRGLEVQVQAWRGEEPLVAREVRCYEVLPGATESLGQAAPEEPGQGQQPTPEDEAEQETPGQ